MTSILTTKPWMNEAVIKNIFQALNASTNISYLIKSCIKFGLLIKAERDYQCYRIFHVIFKSKRRISSIKRLEIDILRWRIFSIATIIPILLIIWRYRDRNAVP